VKKHKEDGIVKSIFFFENLLRGDK